MLTHKASADAPAAHGSIAQKPEDWQLKMDMLSPQAGRPEHSGPLLTTTHAQEGAYDAMPAASVCRKDSADLVHHTGASGNAISSTVSSPMQHSALLQQGLNGNVAAAAAMHYKQQQSILGSTSRGTPAITSLATLPGLQEHQTDAHRVISSTGPSASTAVFSYLGSPKAKTSSTATVARLPAALPGVSSLYGRLRTSALGPATAGTGAAAAAIAATSATGNSCQAAAGSLADSSRCQVLSSPHLWPAGQAASAAGNPAVAQMHTATGDSSADYLSLLMAATSLSAVDASAASGNTTDASALDAQRQLRLVQQLQQLHGSQPVVAQSSNLAGHAVGTVAGLAPTAGLMLQQLPVQHQQLLLAGLGNSSAAVVNQEQLKLINQGSSVAGGLLYNKPAGLQLAGLQQVPPGTTHEAMLKSIAATPGLALNGGAAGLSSALAAFKVDHALAAAAGNAHKVDGAHNPLYKTELCRTWQETGSCRYGARCQFAHGQLELRAVVRPPKYKTQPCRTYSLTGKCPYGARCNFIHDGEEDTVGHRNREESAAAVVSGRVSSNGGPASMNSASGVYFGGNPGPSMDPTGASAAAGLFGTLASGTIDARLGSLTGWGGVLPSDDSYSSSMSAVSLGANAGLCAMNGLGGLALNGITADSAAGINFASGNGVVGLNQLPAGLVAGSGGGVAALAQYGLVGNAQMGLTAMGGGGFTADNFSQML